MFWVFFSFGKSVDQYLKSKYWPESFVKENKNQKTSEEGSGK